MEIIDLDQIVNNTYCPQLWNGITLDEKGGVYSCCHIKPSNLGNVHDLALLDIINSEKIKKYRKQSLMGTLQCYKDCNLIRKNVLNQNSQSLEIKFMELSRIHIHFGNICNIHCIMCNHPNKFSKDPTILSSQILIQTIDFTPFTDIIIQGGEPLAIDECVKFLYHLEKIKKKFILLTNGLLINDEIARLLAKNAKTVSISLNAASQKLHEKVNRGSSFNQVLDNIQKLIYYREYFQSDLVINGRFTITITAIRDLPKFIKNYRSFGFDEINFGYVKNSVPSYLDKNSKTKQELVEEIQLLLPNLNFNEIDTLRLIQIGLLQSLS